MSDHENVNTTEELNASYLSEGSNFPSDPLVFMMQMMMKMEADRRADQERFITVIEEMSNRNGSSSRRLSNNLNRRTSAGARSNEDVEENAESDDNENNRGRRSARTNLRPPPIIEKDVTYRSFKSWSSAWTNYAKATNLNSLPRSDQVATFLTYCSAEFMNTLQYVLGIRSDTTMTLEEVLKTISQHLRGQQNIVVDRYRWLHRCQEVNESFDSFHGALMELTEDADISSMTLDDWISTRIIHGIRDDNAREELLGKRPALNLQETVDLCRNKELAELDRAKLKLPGSSINAMSSKSSKSRCRSRSKGGHMDKEKKCFSCGGSYPHKDGTTCPAKNATCNKCQEKGHYAKCCKDKKEKKTTGAVHIISEVRNRRETHPCLGVDFLLEDTYLDNHVVIADTGAQVSVAGSDVLTQWQINRHDLEESDEQLQGVNGQPIKCIGLIVLTMRVSGCEHKEKIYVCTNIHKQEVYISLKACKGLGLVHEDFPTPLHICKSRELSGEDGSSTIVAVEAKIPAPLRACDSQNPNGDVRVTVDLTDPLSHDTVGQNVHDSNGCMATMIVAPQFMDTDDYSAPLTTSVKSHTPSPLPTKKFM